MFACCFYVVVSNSKMENTETIMILMGVISRGSGGLWCRRGESHSSDRRNERRRVAPKESAPPKKKLGAVIEGSDLSHAGSRDDPDDLR